MSNQNHIEQFSPYELQIRTRAAAESRGAQWPYPWTYMPQDGRPYSRRGSVAAPAFTIANQVTIAEMEIPNGYMGVLTWIYAFYAGSGFVNGSGDVVFTVDVNTPLGTSPFQGYGLPDYSAFTMALGSANNPWPLPGGWVLNEGDVVRVKAYTVGTVGTGAPNYVHGGLLGWTWPSQKGVGAVGGGGRWS